MPLAERILEPFKLGGRHAEDLESVGGPAHLTEANDSLVGILQQIASLVRHADDIFCDISDECQKICDRTESISKKIIHVEDCVKNLDAKNVQIPVGDLTKFSQVTDHHEAKHGFDCDIFTRETRPQCIKDQYNLSEVSPSNIIRAADIYRKDGMCGSKIFRLWPMLMYEAEVRSPDLGFSRRSLRVKTFEKRYKRLKERPKTIHGTCDLFPDIYKDENKNDSEELIPSLPPTTIPIDTSGTGFRRMEFLRESMKKIEKEDVKKKKRRRTVSGVPENIMQEIEQFERKHRRNKSLTDQTHIYSFDDLDTSFGTDRDETMAKYLDEIDAKMEERNEGEYYLKEPKIMKLFPCRRSKSLPRCVKLYSQKFQSAEKQSLVGSSRGNSTVSLASMGSVASRLSRSTKRSSVISNKIKSLVRSASKDRERQRPRPKSLDLDALDFDQDTRDTIALAKMPSMPDGVLLNDDRQLKVGPGSYYNFECNTLPRSYQRRKEALPWEHVPKDWTTSVKLREISKSRSREDKCSSGHWSGSSSNRHSLDSDNVKSDCMQTAVSQYSLGQDSGRDSPLPDDDRSRCGTESTGGFGGDEASTTVGDGESSSESKADTEAWLQSLASRAASRDEVSSSSADTLNSLSQLTKKNIMALDLMMSPSGRKPLRYLDEEEGSVYSLDQEGFYTSFHNDSGLRRSTDTLDGDDIDVPPGKDSHSICSFESVIHNPNGDHSLHTAGLKKGSPNLSSKPVKRVRPPPPPRRTSSISGPLSSSAVEDSSEMEFDNTKSPSVDFSRQDSSSVSESDQESIYTRVKMKTKISSTAIPSLCPMFSDDDSLIGKRPEGDIDCLLHDEDVYSYRKDLCEVIDMNHHGDKAQVRDSSMFSISSYDGSISDPSLNNKSGMISDQSFERSSVNEDYFCEGNDSKTLPRKYHLSNKNEKKQDYTHSWPRTRNKGDKLVTSPVSGILKNSDQYLGGARPPKSLNFSPVVNMFNPGTPLAVQVPLPASPSSSEEGCHISKGDKLMKLAESSSYKLTMPLHKKPEDRPESHELPLKYQPVITIKPGNRPKSLPGSEKQGAYVNLSPVTNSSNMSFGKPSGPYSNSSLINVPFVQPVSKNSTCYAISPVCGNSKQRNSESGPILSADSGYMDMNGNGKIGSNSASLSSITSFESFDTKDSLTYVSMTSPCSSPNLSNLDIPLITTPTGSVESLQNVTKINGYSGDESNLSTTMETVAITTKSFNSSTVSNDNSYVSDNKSLAFRTFSGPMSPVNDPMSSSTPYSSQSKPTNCASRNSQFQYDQKARYNGNILDSDVRPSRYSRRRIVSSQSAPSSISSYFSGSGQEHYPYQEHYPDQNGKPVINVQNMEQTSHTARSGSYRVAMVNPHRTESYRVALKESASCPVFPQHGKPPPVRVSANHNMALPKSHFLTVNNAPTVAAADFNRTDSYRVAVRNTHGVVPPDQNKNRNSSYRVAVFDNVPNVNGSQFDSLHSGIQNGRDIRRMGITDVDQLKGNNNMSEKSPDLSSVPLRHPSSSRHSNKKADVDPISVLSNRENVRSAKGKQPRPVSSTYISFDPIFEIGEDMTNSMESLRPSSSYGSLKMAGDCGSGSSLHQDNNRSEKPKVNAMNSKIGKISTGEKTSASSLLGSIKNTFKAMSGNNNKQQKEIEIEDDWRFTSV